jgi:hypothetical protein
MVQEDAHNSMVSHRLLRDHTMKSKGRIQMVAFVMVAFLVARGFHGLQSNKLDLRQLSFTTTNGTTAVNARDTHATVNEADLGIDWEIGSIYNPSIKSAKDSTPVNNQGNASRTSTPIATPAITLIGNEDLHHANAAILDLLPWEVESKLYNHQRINRTTTMEIDVEKNVWFDKVPTHMSKTCALGTVSNGGGLTLAWKCGNRGQASFDHVRWLWIFYLHCCLFQRG